MTDDELSFIKHYIKNGNVHESAKASGITDKQAYAIFENPILKQQINLGRASSLITEEYILGNIKRVADISLGDSPLPNTITKEIPEGLRSYDSTAALRALELLGKNHKLFTDKIEALNVQTPFEKYIKQVEDENEY